MKTRWLIGALLAALSVVGFASTFVSGGELTKDMGISPIVLVFLRFAIAGGAMLATGLASSRTRPALFALKPREWKRLL